MKTKKPRKWVVYGFVVENAFSIVTSIFLHLLRSVKGLLKKKLVNDERTKCLKLLKKERSKQHLKEIIDELLALYNIRLRNLNASLFIIYRYYQMVIADIYSQTSLYRYNKLNNNHIYFEIWIFISSHNWLCTLRNSNIILTSEAKSSGGFTRNSIALLTPLTLL